MSRFKTAVIENKASDWEIARRKGSRVRYQNKITTAMTGWMPTIESQREAANAALDNVRQNTDNTLDKMTVAALRALAGDRGIKVPSKARKADIIAALTN